MSKRWTYQVLELKPKGAAGIFSFGVNAAQLQEELVRQGQQGWELVNTTTLGTGTKVAIFKREQ
jgi:hypothetical protein